MELDLRLISLSIEISGQIRTYTNLAITATGVKFGNPNQGQCDITIANLDTEVANYILTESSPFNRNRTPKRIVLSAGRESTGLSVLYIGNLFRASITQPPDAVVTIRSLSGVFVSGNIVARSFTESVLISRIAEQVSEDMGTTLDFQATDRRISNYSFTGAANKQMEKLAEMAPLDVYVDNEVLVVKDLDVPLRGRVRRLNADTGMIGVPTFTEQGVQVTFLYDNQTVLGGRLDIESNQYPALTGSYVIYKLAYQIANRDVPFYFIADCHRLPDG